MLWLWLFIVFAPYDWGDIFGGFLADPWISESYDPSIAAFLHILSGAAYVQDNTLKDACISPLEVTSFHQEHLGDDNLGHVAFHRNGPRSFIAIYFAGTQNDVQLFHQWVQSSGESFFDVSGAEVMKYFEEVIEKMWDRISGKTLELLAECPDCIIYFTGHSLGGALAMVALSHFLYHGIFDASSPVTLYTFGQPRAGNRAYAKWIEALNLPIFRVVHDKDMAVHVPCCRQNLFFNCVDKPGKYSPWHVYPEIFYDSGFESWRECSGNPKGEDKDCANKYRVSQLSVDDHRYYFQVHTSHICDAIVENRFQLQRPLRQNETLANSTEYQLREFTWPKLC